MILVVMGSNEAVAEEVVKEFMTLFPAQCRRLYANHFAEPGQRSAYLARALTDAAYSSENVTLIPQVQTDGELNMLRMRGAYVMHVYGALSSLTPISRLIAGITSLSARRASNTVLGMSCLLMRSCPISNTVAAK
jgi:hypothetical protein